jgi:flagellar basal body-associated protein FliL
MKKNSAKKKMFVTTILAGLLIFGVWALGYHDKKINLRGISLTKIIMNKEETTNVRCGVLRNIGEKDLLSMDMVIPCEDKEQLADLNKKMHMIKSDFLTNFDQTKVDEWVKNGEFGVIKTELLKIVNLYTDKPVENLYFDSFISR